MSSSETIGGDALKFLQVLKREKPGSGSIAASANDLQKVIRQLERLAGVSTSSVTNLLSTNVCVHVAISMYRHKNRADCIVLQYITPNMLQAMHYKHTKIQFSCSWSQYIFIVLYMFRLCLELMRTAR